MRKLLYVCALLPLLILAIGIIWTSFSHSNLITLREDREGVASGESIEMLQFVSNDDVRVTSPRPSGVIRSPLNISGEARGTWFFEASFQITLVNWDGLVIAESHAQAMDNWMTAEYVPFASELEFEKPYVDAGSVPEFMKRGTLILQRANPSGLPEHDDVVEIPVRFD